MILKKVKKKFQLKHYGKAIFNTTFILAFVITIFFYKIDADANC